MSLLLHRAWLKACRGLQAGGKTLCVCPPLPLTVVLHVCCGVQILLRHPQHVKALFRRGRARTELGRTEEALQDLVKAAEL